MVQTIVTIFDAIDKTSGKVQHIEKAVKNYGTKIRELTGYYDEAGDMIKGTDKTITGLTKRFQAQYLSTLFFGMAISRMFNKIRIEGIDTFLKITEGQTQTGQALLGLSAGFEFLKFSIGDALGMFIEPFLPTILEIIEKVSDWIANNRELVGGLIIIGGAVGSLMMSLSVLKLGLGGISAILGTGGGGVLGALTNPALLAAFAAFGILLVGVADNTDDWKLAIDKVIVALGNITNENEKSLNEIGKDWDDAAKAIAVAIINTSISIQETMLYLGLAVENIIKAMIRNIYKIIAAAFPTPGTIATSEAINRLLAPTVLPAGTNEAFDKMREWLRESAFPMEPQSSTLMNYQSGMGPTSGQGTVIISNLTVNNPRNDDWLNDELRYRGVSRK